MPDHETDKPAGTEQHPPGANPARQGPDRGKADPEQPPPDAQPPASGAVEPEGSPGEPGITSPQR